MPRSGPLRRNNNNGFTVRQGSLSQFAMQRPRSSASISSASLQKVDALRAPIGPPEGWQRDAYGFYETIGELAEVLNETSGSVAQCDFRPISLDGTGSPTAFTETEDERVLRVWNAFEPPRGGKPELIRKAALHLQIAGESFLVGQALETDYGVEAGVSWEFLSGEEIKVENNGKSIKRNFGYAGMQPVELDPKSYIARLWRSDPKYSEKADCATKHVLPICSEIVLLTQVVDAIAKSRLSAGILFVPDEMSFGPFDETEDDSDETDDIDPFTQELIEQLTAPVEDRTSAASLVPLIMRGPAEFADKILPIAISRDLDHMYQDMRLEAIKRLATGLDIPIEIMFGKGGLNHWCVSDDTKVLSKDRGWVNQKDLFVGDVILTLNHDTGLSEWQPVEDIYRADVVDEPMVSIEGDRHSSLTTPNHRWPTLHKVRENYRDPETGKMTSRPAGHERIWTTSEKLNSNDSLVVAAPCVELPIEAKWSDAMVEAVAWLWTEGSYNYSGRLIPQVHISQSHTVNPDKVLRIRSALTQLFGPPSDEMPPQSYGQGGPVANETPMWREHQRPGDRTETQFWLNQTAGSVFVDLAPDRVVPTSFIQELTRSQLELFIDISVQADGTILKSGGCMHIAQKDARRLEALELACILTGRSTSIYPWRTGTPRVDMTMLSISNKTTFGLGNGKKINDTTYTGTIWCPVTANKSWYAKCNGKVSTTGNTGYNIDQDFITKHVAPVGEMIAEFLTAAFLRPMLIEFEGMTEEEANQYRIYFDSSKITSRTDTGPNARAAFDRKAISEKTYLRESGFDESDMPNEEERKMRDLRALMEAEPVIFGPQVIGMLYPDLAGKITVPVGLPDQGPQAPTDPNNPNPQRGNHTGPNSDPVIDNETGNDEPIPRGPSGPRMEETLIDRLATASDAALERALERAGNRLLSKMNSSEEMRAHYRDVPVTRIVSTVSDSEYRTLKITPAELFDGAWDTLSVRGKGWLRQFFMEKGDDSFKADEKATMVVNALIDLLHVLVASTTKRPLSVGTNGLRVPHDLILFALEQAERVD